MRAGGIILILLVLQLAAPSVLAQAGGPAGPNGIYLGDRLVVGENETFRPKAGSVLYGPGHVEVHGRLDALGNASAPIIFRVPVVLMGNATARIEHGRFEGITGAALTVQGGNLTLVDVAFDDNVVGLLARSAPDSTLNVANATFRRHAVAGVQLRGVAAASFGTSTFTDNLLGFDATLDASPMALRVSTSRFERNREHVSLDLGRAEMLNVEARFVSNAFLGPLGSFAARSALPADAPVDGASPLVRLADNSIRGATVGVIVRGGGFGFESWNDTFDSNDISMSIAAATVKLTDVRFASLVRDIDLAPDAQVEATNVTYTPSRATSDGDPPLVGVILGAILVGGAVLIGLRRARDRKPALARPQDPPPEQAPLLAPTAPTPTFTDIELRVLHDIRAHPASTQSAIAERLGLSRQALHYHVKKLSTAGWVEKTPRGRSTECRLADGVELPPLPPTVTQPDAMEKE